MSAHHRARRRLLALALLAACGTAAQTGSAIADDTSSPFSVRIKLNAKLLPVLHATEVVAFAEDGWEYDYVTKGYFKVADKTVARLPTFSGHADRTEQHLRLPIKRSTRHTIRAVARHHRTRHVILVLVHHLTLTTSLPGAVAPSTQTVTQNADLTIPRN
jgi:hypothetical protein